MTPVVQAVCDLIRWAAEGSGQLVVFLLSFPLTWMVLMLAALVYAVKSASGSTT